MSNPLARLIGITVLALAPLHCLASTEVFKCEQNGQTSYSQTPCASAAQQKTVAVKTPPVDPKAVEQQRRQLEAQKREASHLESARHRLEYARDKEMRSIAAKNEKQKRLCSRLRAQAAWANEDLSAASPKHVEKARRKARRAEARLTLECSSQ